MGLFDEVLFNICFGIARLVQVLEGTFYKLSGITQGNVLPGDNTLAGGVGNDLLSIIFFDKSNGITFNKIYLFFMGMGICILSVVMIISIIKSFVNKEDETKTLKLVYARSGQSLILMVIMPLLFITAITGTFIILATITQLFNIDGSTSIADQIVKSCFSGKGDTSALVANMSYNTFKTFAPNYNLWLLLLVSCCAGVGFVMVIFTIVERLIHIFFLYLVSPFVIAKQPLDQGRSFEQWRDILLAKFFSLVGVIICLQCFLIILKILQNSMRDEKLVVLFFTVGGIFTFTKAGTLVAQLISNGAGQFEGMSQGTSLGMLSTAGRMAGRLASNATKGLTRGVAGGIGNSISNLSHNRALKKAGGSLGTNAGAEDGAFAQKNTGDGGSLQNLAKNYAMGQMATQQGSGFSKGSSGGFGGMPMGMMPTSMIFGYMAGKVGVASLGKIGSKVGSIIKNSSPVINAKTKQAGRKLDKLSSDRYSAKQSNRAQKQGLKASKQIKRENMVNKLNTNRQAVYRQKGNNKQWFNDLKGQAGLKILNQQQEKKDKEENK